MRCAFVLAAVTTVIVGQELDEHGRFTSNPSACVLVDHSDGWSDGASQTDRFSTRFVVSRDVWLPHMRFVVTWAEFATVENAYGVTQKENAGLSSEQGHSATFELMPDQAHLPPNGLPGSFQLMGHDTQLPPISIVCSNETIVAANPETESGDVAAALPVDASLSDCDLGAHWRLTNAYARLSDAEMRMDTWEAGRLVTLIFVDQEISAANAQHAALKNTITDGTDTIISFTLGTFGTSQLCQTGHVENGVYVRDVNCGGPTGSEPPVVSFQLQPGPSKSPRVICTRGMSPPPPPPNYFETMAAIAPPPRVDAAAAIAAQLKAQTAVQHPPPPAPPPVLQATACSAGGLAVVQHATKSGDQQTMRIIVKPDYLWPTGYGYVVGLKGLEMRVSHTVRRAPLI